MSDSEFLHERRPAWRVVRAMAAELQRQGRTLSIVDGDGTLEVAGRIDLASLANVVEISLGREFGI